MKKSKHIESDNVQIPLYVEIARGKHKGVRGYLINHNMSTLWETVVYFEKCKQKRLKCDVKDLIYLGGSTSEVFR